MQDTQQDSDDEEPVTKKDVKVSRPLVFKKASVRASEDVTAAEINETTRRFAEEQTQVRLRRQRTDELLELFGRSDNIEKIRSLLEQGVDLNAYDEAGNSIMHHAVERRDTNALILLLEAGMDMHVRNFKGVTPLMVACLGYDTEACGVILTDADPDLSFHAVGGIHALHVAAVHRKTRIVEKLLERGVPADIEDEEGHTPLYYAIASKSDAAAEVICMAGGFRKKDMPELQKAIAMEVMYSRDFDYELLLKHVAKLDPQKLKENFPHSSHAAPQLIKPEGRKVFEEIDNSTGSGFQMAKFADDHVALAARNADGQTPLMAALNSNVSMWATRDLVYSSLATAVDNACRTPLHYAVKHVHPGDTVVGVLLTRGANMDAQDLFGRTPVMVSIATCGDHIERLVERGANLALKDLLGLTALDIAKIRKSDYAVDKLKKKKAPKKPFQGRAMG